ncbi:hypothetical protein [Antrihabitans cavernicola]|uniref:DNA-binding protein n=1 Tax=Antrihabitans cavernicola TaxID=2495913 RepID=A0A5A7SG07_9NOCA|nr:hypothetical protein [Spelaeibacter cavernicola]KAA0023597.1 hypothetical protein FOY51_09410 [Spelaeibacter cavernicola]
MLVMTIDQRRSRRDVDRVAQLLADLADEPLVRPFERTAGDEVQAVADDPRVVVDIALRLVVSGHWSIGIGIGAVEQPLPRQTRAGRGPAFEEARDAVTRAKNAPAGLAVAGTNTQAAADAEAILTLLAMLVGRRSAEGHAAVDQMRRGLSQSEAADTLGISKQAVSQRLSTAGWQAEGPARSLAERLLNEADNR